VWKLALPGFRAGSRVAPILAAALVAGCGGSHTPTPAARSSLERDWLANARQLVATLEADVLLSADGGANVATARRALSNSSDLYAMVIAYTDFAGCGRVLGSFGRPAPAAEAARAALDAACVRLERAAALFHQAMSGNDVKTLLAATRASLAAEPLLVRTKEALAS
jgi:hypothetical protein